MSIMIMVLVAKAFGRAHQAPPHGEQDEKESRVGTNASQPGSSLRVSVLPVLVVSYCGSGGTWSSSCYISDVYTCERKASLYGEHGYTSSNISRFINPLFEAH